MTHPETKVIIKDISSKVTNPREDLLKETEIRKPFIFKGYTSEEDRIKDVVYNNRLLYNLPDYPEVNHKLKKEKTSRQINDNIKYNFNLDIPKTIKTINSNDDINRPIHTFNNIIVSQKPNEDSNSYNITKNHFLKNKFNFGSIRRMSIVEKNKLNELIKKNLIYQPQMRFKARTDLERVYDNLSSKNLNEKDKHIIEKQLTNINLYKYKKPKDLLNIQNKKSNEEDEIKLDDKKYNILPNPLIEELKKEREKINKEKLLFAKTKLYYEPKNNNKKLWARKENLNNEAKKFLSSYHYKTHFKATEEVQFNIKNKYHSVDKDINTYLMIPNIFNTENNELSSKKLKNNRNFYSFNCDYDELDKKKDIFNFGEDQYKDEEEENLIDYKDLDKQFRNNPIYDDVKKNKYNPDSLKILSKIAFKKLEKTIENEDEQKTEDYDEKSINILNNRFSKRNKSNLLDDENIHNTAKTILGECKIYTGKSKYNNSFLKSGAGKNMITKGLSLNEFLKKYSLKE